MKQVIITVVVIALFAAGLGAGYFYLKKNQSTGSTPEPTEPVAGETQMNEAPAQHGSFPTIPPGAATCSTHRVPEMICPFCNPDVVDEFGHCGGHDVAEALCTRCHPILISAFKAEGDWCAEHNLPESQCQICAGQKG